MIYTSQDLSHLHSGQVLQRGWRLGILPISCGDTLGFGGPVTQTKLNFPVFGVFILLGYSKGMAQLFHSIPMSRQVNMVSDSIFCLPKKSFFQGRLSLNDTLGSAFLFFPCRLPRSSHISDCLSITVLCCQDTDLIGVDEDVGVNQPPSCELTRTLAAFVSIVYGSFSWLLQNKQLYKL